MFKKYIRYSLVIAAVGVLCGGCYSPDTEAYLVSRKIKVVDSSTKRPIVGAHVALYDSAGQSMGQVTNDKGNMYVAYGVTFGVPKYNEIQVSRDGYQSVALHLTNGLPHQVELAPSNEHK